jgi:ATP-dependent helicase/nuclease subunit B
MPVTFVLGRAGSGKTRRCFQSIAKALRDDPLGPPIFWILPRQATFNAERDLACSADLGGFCRARIVSFDQLGREVFDECGGTAIPELTPLGRQMLIGHLLRKLEPRLQLFGGSARRVGLAAELELVFTEIERGGHGADELAAMIRKLEARPACGIDGDSLLAKLRDIGGRIRFWPSSQPVNRFATPRCTSMDSSSSRKTSGSCWPRSAKSRRNWKSAS